MNEMKHFFMKHYNDTYTYQSELKSLNLREREKDNRRDRISS